MEAEAPALSRPSAEIKRTMGVGGKETAEQGGALIAKIARHSEPGSRPGASARVQEKMKTCAERIRNTC